MREAAGAPFAKIGKNGAVAALFPVRIKLH
jgi:hypothetical protein